jgi:hypothetical protein
MPAFGRLLASSRLGPSGAARSAHLPVKEKAAGSNPVWGANLPSFRTARAPPNTARGASGVTLGAPAPSSSQVRTPPFQGGSTGSNPVGATTEKVQLRVHFLPLDSLRNMKGWCAIGARQSSRLSLIEF